MKDPPDLHQLDQDLHSIPRSPGTGKNQQYLTMLSVPTTPCVDAQGQHELVGCMISSFSALILGVAMISCYAS